MESHDQARCSAPWATLPGTAPGTAQPLKPTPPRPQSTSLQCLGRRASPFPPPPGGFLCPRSHRTQEATAEQGRGLRNHAAHLRSRKEPPRRRPGPTAEVAPERSPRSQRRPPAQPASPRTNGALRAAACVQVGHSRVRSRLTGVQCGHSGLRGQVIPGRARVLGGDRRSLPCEQ